MARASARYLRVERGALRVRAYPVLIEAVEAGVAIGWNRAFKHEDAPHADTIREHIEREVLNAICERFDFPADSES
jgi:hypothetical protein